MNRRKFRKIIIDTESQIYVENWKISNQDIDLDSTHEWYIHKRRLYGGKQDNVDIIEINNGLFSFIVVPTRGMGIWKGKFKNCFLGWNSPIKQLVNPCYVKLEERSGLGWLDGFNEWIVRCGLESNGAPGEDIIIDNMGREKRVFLPLHGRIANIPADKVEILIDLESPFELSVNGVTYERSMFGSNFKMSTSITTTLESNSIKIIDVIENLRAIPTEMQLIYHCNYGEPFLEDGSTLIAPIKRVAPRDQRAVENIDNFSSFSGPKTGFIEQVYFLELLGDDKSNTMVMLKNKEGDKGTSISFSLKQLPCFTLWKNTATYEDGYVVGLEPGTNFPNNRAFEREKGRVIKMAPNAKYTAEITLAVHLDEEVKKIEEYIKKLQGKVKPEIFKKIHPDFSKT
ncbi:MAG: aldose 1-epimerase family protein [Thermoplasmata archaeon]